MGIFTAIAVVGAGIGIAAVSASQAKDAEKRQKGIADDAQRAADEQAKNLKEASLRAEEEAKEQVKSKRQSMTQTILTSPIGVTGTAPTIKSTLGSAGV